MQYIEGLEGYQNTERTAVTLGKFDGLHRGHEKLISQVIRLAEAEGLDSVVCSFNMQSFFESIGTPREVLMTKEEQRMRLEGRVDYLIDCPFTEAFSRMPAEDFIRKILAGLFHAA